MKSAARLFYLTLFAVWHRPICCQTQHRTDSLSDDDDACAFSPSDMVSDACTSYSTLARLNRAVKPAVNDLVTSTDFFSHYRLNLFHRECPFWSDENGMCGNIACAVETLDNEDDIPEVWRASSLGKLEGPLASTRPGRLSAATKIGPGGDESDSCDDNGDDDDEEYDDRDYCVPEDERATSPGDYVSLLRNPERFTGYAGAGSAQVWDAIYRENCFPRTPSSSPQHDQDTTSHNPLNPGFPETPNPPARDFKAVLDAFGREQVLAQQRALHDPRTPFVASTGLEGADECLEKRVFYRVISGMHASISSHLCWDHLNQQTGEWTPNLACYRSRLHGHPDRIQNLFFNYALLTRAIAKLGPTLSDRRRYVFCAADGLADESTRERVRAVTNAAASVPHIFDETLMFKEGEGPALKEDFRQRFRNVSRLMDCVGCDKCRLWGKVQTAGYGTALKVLFELDQDEDQDLNHHNNHRTPGLKRTELVALFNTYARLSSSLNAIGKFRTMMAAEEMGRTVDKVEEGKMDKEEGECEVSVILEGNGSSTETKQKDETVQDVFDTELSRVFQALGFVMRSWLGLPAMLWHITTSEITRLWQFYIGLPVQPRSWTIDLSRRSVDEL